MELLYYAKSSMPKILKLNNKRAINQKKYKQNISTAIHCTINDTLASESKNDFNAILRYDRIVKCDLIFNINNNLIFNL